jgi:hypothetical protein
MPLPPIPPAAFISANVALIWRNSCRTASSLDEAEAMAVDLCREVMGGREELAAKSFAGEFGTGMEEADGRGKTAVEGVPKGKAPAPAALAPRDDNNGTYEAVEEEEAVDFLWALDKWAVKSRAEMIGEI